MAAFAAAAVDPQIRALLDERLNEAVGDIEDGPGRAGRSPADTRRLRGVIVITDLDQVARHRKPATGRDELPDVLTESRLGTIGRYAGGVMASDRSAASGRS